MHSLIPSRLKLFGFGEKSLKLGWAQGSLSGVISHGELRGQIIYKVSVAWVEPKPSENCSHKGRNSESH